MPFFVTKIWEIRLGYERQKLFVTYIIKFMQQFSQKKDRNSPDKADNLKLLHDLKRSAKQYPETVAESLVIQNRMVDTLFRYIRAAIFLLSPDMKIWRSNPYAQLMFGFSDDELKGKRIESLLGGKAERSVFLKEIRAAKKAVNGVLCAVLRTKEGTAVNVEFTLNSILNIENKTLGYLMIGYGKPTSEMTTISHGLILRIMDGFSEAALIVRPFSRVLLECNSAAEALFGYHRDELVGASARILYRHEEDFLSFGIRSEDAFTKQGIYQEEGQMRRKDGSFFDMRLTMFPVFNGEAGIDFLIAIVQDVSQDINKVREAHTLILQIHSLIEKIIPLVSPPSNPKPLSLKMLGATDRQVEITRLLLSGDSTKEIASRLNLSVSTVKNHLSALYKKLEIYDRVDLVRIIQERHIKII